MENTNNLEGKEPVKGEVTCSDPFCRCHKNWSGPGHCGDCAVLPTISVVLGLALPDHTWIEKTIEFKIDPEWESNPDGILLARMAFDRWCHDFATKGPTATAYEKAEAASKISVNLSGYFLISWEWKD